MLLEQSQHSESAFVTLTYEDEPRVYHQETDQWIPTLAKSHLQKWIRSVRKKATQFGVPLRYFACGEYGEKKGRPHYHIITFGTGPFWDDMYKESWSRGFVSSYEATPRAMAYVAKYCLKGGSDPELSLPTSTPHLPAEENRVSTPPFRLMSRRPAIGTTFAPNIARALTAKNHGLGFDPGLAGPANQVRIGGRKYPLDRTMKVHLEAALLQRGVNHYQVAAMLNRDFGDPTNEEIQRAREAHLKARSQRHSRAKL